MIRDRISFDLGMLYSLIAKSHQYNVANWPYIAPVVKYKKMKSQVASEYVCCEESHNLYYWVLTAMSEMEPRFWHSDIRLIFAHQLLTVSLLEGLGIADTCELRGDYHHLMNEVWPNKFGKGTFYTHLRPHLDRFLKGTEEEWHQAYRDASDILIGDAEKHSFLDHIYANPQYYVWWHLRKIEGNLN